MKLHTILFSVVGSLRTIERGTGTLPVHQPFDLFQKNLGQIGLQRKIPPEVTESCGREKTYRTVALRVFPLQYS
jgi:hypothetical protein